MPSTIVPLTWPEHEKLNNPERFETVARRLRYQALGLACRERQIKTLLVAHHADDQAETILMRLIQRRFRSGLQGIQSVQWIPECHGIHGVHHSGDADGLILEPEENKKPPTPFPIEQGGIQLLRPLLNFDKSRLIATCQANSIPWAEDSTNQMPTFTKRNAVRHVLQNHKLPEALNPKALVSLAQHMQHRVESHRRHAEQILLKTPLALDIQTGALIVRFPPASAFLSSPYGDLSKESDKNPARNTAFLYLERIAELVSPKPATSVGQFSSAVDQIWPALRLEEDTTSSQEPAPEASVSVSGVWFRQSAVPPQVLETAGIFPTESSQSNTKDARPIYLLSRQPLGTSREASSVQITIPTSLWDRTLANTWRLFDGRFWLRVDNKLQGAYDVVVRMLTTQEALELKAGKRYEGSIFPTLSYMEPPSLHTTIPALFRKNSGIRPTFSYSGGGTAVNQFEEEEETLLALPTLGLRVPSTSTELDLDWEVRYKNISLAPSIPSTSSPSKDISDICLPWSWQPGWTEDYLIQRYRHLGRKRPSFKWYWGKS